KRTSGSAPHAASISSAARPASKLASLGIGWPAMMVRNPGKLFQGFAGTTSRPLGENSEGSAATRPDAIAAAALPTASTRMAENLRRSNSQSPIRQMLPARATVDRTVSATSIAESVSRKIPRAMAFRSAIALDRFESSLLRWLGAACRTESLRAGHGNRNVLVLAPVAHANRTYQLVREHQRHASAQWCLRRLAPNRQPQAHQ